MLLVNGEPDFLTTYVLSHTTSAVLRRPDVAKMPALYGSLFQGELYDTRSKNKQKTLNNNNNTPFFIVFPSTLENFPSMPKWEH